MRLIEGEARIWMTRVCVPRSTVVLETHVTRFLFIAGLTESPGSLESLVGTFLGCSLSAADGTSIWRLHQQTRKLAERRDERIYESSPVRFKIRFRKNLIERNFCAAHNSRLS